MTLQDPAWLDRVYNNRALVPDHAEFLARWTTESEQVRAIEPCTLDLPYGNGPRETLDIFPATGDAKARTSAPVLVFIHGGYWRSLDKSGHSFIAPSFTREGFCVVMPNYPLCPGTPDRPVCIPDIVLCMVRALEWTWRHIAEYGGDPSRITVAGHSAGGHLAAMLLACEWGAVAAKLPTNLVRNALSISGVHDLRPIQHTPFLMDALRLTEVDAQRASPALFPAPKARTLYAVAGGDESEAFASQARLIQDAWGKATVPVCDILPGLHHFSVLDALIDPTHRLHQHASRLLGA